MTDEFSIVLGQDWVPGESAQRLLGSTDNKGATMSDVVYTSKVRVERIKGPVRRAFLPAEAEPVMFGVHSEIAQYYGVAPDAFPAHATTLDYVVAAAGG